MAHEPKIRLDVLLVQRGLAETRGQARSLVMSGKVRVENITVDKPGTGIRASATVTVAEEESPYVSRGGLKLEAALKDRALSIEGRVCMDVGASTGGFTDCLLRHGATHVYAIDVGYGQLAWRLRNDPRVTVIERTNIRYMPVEAVPGPMDVVTIDVSFISLKIVVPAVLKFTHPDTDLLALIKPQFEVGKGRVGKGGVVRNPDLHSEVVEDLSAFFDHAGLSTIAIVPSPVPGPKGNREFMTILRRKG